MIGLQILSLNDGPVTLSKLLEVIAPHISSLWFTVSDLESVLGSGASEQTAKQFKAAEEKFAIFSFKELDMFSMQIAEVNWGAFLGFHKKDLPREFEHIPMSEGRPHSLQHPDAQIEIQAVDGQYFEVFARDENVLEAIEEVFVTLPVDSEINY